MPMILLSWSAGPNPFRPGGGLGSLSCRSEQPRALQALRSPQEGGPNSAVAFVSNAASRAHTRAVFAQNVTRGTVSTVTMLCTCASCGISFQSPRRDALYCSRSRRMRACHAAQSAFPRGINLV